MPPPPPENRPRSGTRTLLPTSRPPARSTTTQPAAQQAAPDSTKGANNSSGGAQQHGGVGSTPAPSSPSTASVPPSTVVLGDSQVRIPQRVQQKWGGDGSAPNSGTNRQRPVSPVSRSTVGSRHNSLPPQQQQQQQSGATQGNPSSMSYNSNNNSQQQPSPAASTQLQQQTAISSTGGGGLYDNQSYAGSGSTTKGAVGSSNNNPYLGGGASTYGSGLYEPIATTENNNNYGSQQQQQQQPSSGGGGPSAGGTTSSPDQGSVAGRGQRGGEAVSSSPVPPVVSKQPIPPPAPLQPVPSLSPSTFNNNNNNNSSGTFNSTQKGPGSPRVPTSRPASSPAGSKSLRSVNDSPPSVASVQQPGGGERVSSSAPTSQHQGGNVEGGGGSASSPPSSPRKAPPVLPASRPASSSFGGEAQMMTTPLKPSSTTPSALKSEVVAHHHQNHPHHHTVVEIVADIVVILLDHSASASSTTTLSVTPNKHQYVSPVRASDKNNSDLPIRRVRVKDVPIGAFIVTPPPSSDDNIIEDDQVLSVHSQRPSSTLISQPKKAAAAGTHKISLVPDSATTVRRLLTLVKRSFNFMPTSTNGGRGTLVFSVPGSATAEEGRGGGGGSHTAAAPERLSELMAALSSGKGITAGGISDMNTSSSFVPSNPISLQKSASEWCGAFSGGGGEVNRFSSSSSSLAPVVDFFALVERAGKTELVPRSSTGSRLSGGGDGSCAPLSEGRMLAEYLLPAEVSQAVLREDISHNSHYHSNNINHSKTSINSSTSYSTTVCKNIDNDTSHCQNHQVIKADPLVLYWVDVALNSSINNHNLPSSSSSTAAAALSPASYHHQSIGSKLVFEPLRFSDRQQQLSSPLRQQGGTGRMMDNNLLLQHPNNNNYNSATGRNSVFKNNTPSSPIPSDNHYHQHGVGGTSTSSVWASPSEVFQMTGSPVETPYVTPRRPRQNLQAPVTPQTTYERASSNFNNTSSNISPQRQQPQVQQQVQVQQQQQPVRKVFHAPPSSKGSAATPSIASSREPSLYRAVAKEQQQLRAERQLREDIYDLRKQIPRAADMRRSHSPNDNHPHPHHSPPPTSVSSYQQQQQQHTDQQQPRLAAASVVAPTSTTSVSSSAQRRAQFVDPYGTSIGGGGATSSVDVNGPMSPEGIQQQHYNNNNNSSSTPGVLERYYSSFDGDKDGPTTTTPIRPSSSSNVARGRDPSVATTTADFSVSMLQHERDALQRELLRLQELRSSVAMETASLTPSTMSMTPRGKRGEEMEEEEDGGVYMAPPSRGGRKDSYHLHQHHHNNTPPSLSSSSPPPPPPMSPPPPQHRNY